MTEFLTSLKADLQDRRLAPLVVVVVLALVGALAYALTGGGSSAAPATAQVTPPVTSPGIAISQNKAEKAPAEMTSGAAEQRHGVARDPFTLLPGATKTAAAASPAPSASGNTGSSSAGSKTETAPSKESAPTPAKPSKPAKPQTVYHVAALFGVIPAGAAPLTTQLTPYESLKLLTPLPSAKQPLVVFRGVTAHGKSATFTVVGETILHGNGVCLPSASQCKAIDLQPDHYEQLEYLAPSGETVVYELRIVQITSSKGSTAAVKSLLGSESKAGRELLRHAGLLRIPYLRGSATQAGVLVFAGHGASLARAHGAAHHRRGR